MFDYTQVTAAGVTSRAEEALKEADRILAGVIDSSVEGTYQTVMQPLDDINDLLHRIYGTTAFLGYVHPDREVRDAANAVEERLQKWGVDLVFRDDLYRVVKAYRETAEADRLEGERARFLEFWMRDLRRAGHELDESTRSEVKRLT
ncbi:MAG TPA: hypothetical protein VLA54_00500, partial [Acidimicrobiia bacterium]|nr:hypothetical protein [Acidimicrobiia bacterium]